MGVVQIIETSFIVLALSMVAGAVYRIYLHPLAHIPGPKLAALTWWYEFYFDIVYPGQYVFHIQKLHQKYGPIIRITPEELHINDVGFLDTIYASSSGPRDKYPRQIRALRLQGGVGPTASHDLHKKRRDALSPFFARRNILYLESLIISKSAQLCQIMASHAADKTPLNLSDVLFAFTNDIAANFLFAHQVDNLADETKAAALRRNTYELLKGVHRNKHLPWIIDILESVPKSISKPLMPPGLMDMLALRDRVRNELVAIMETKASGDVQTKPVFPTGKESVFNYVLDSSSLPASEKTLPRLNAEGVLLVLAGSESPAKVFSVVIYHLLANPPILAKLRDELNTHPSATTWTQLEKLRYLSAIIEEGVRLSFGVTARMVRIAYEPLTYKPSQYADRISIFNKSYVIPAGTPMSTTTLSAHTAERAFPDPFAFKPERWLGENGHVVRKFQMSFGKGSRKCLGIELAHAELYLVIATLVRRFEMKLWNTDDDDVAFVHDYQVSMPRFDSEGIRVTVEEL